MARTSLSTRFHLDPRERCLNILSVVFSRTLGYTRVRRICSVETRISPSPYIRPTVGGSRARAIARRFNAAPRSTSVWSPRPNEIFHFPSSPGYSRGRSAAVLPEKSRAKPLLAARYSINFYGLAPAGDSPQTLGTTVSVYVTVPRFPRASRDSDAGSRSNCVRRRSRADAFSPLQPCVAAGSDFYSGDKGAGSDPSELRSLRTTEDVLNDSIDTSDLNDASRERENGGKTLRREKRETAARDFPD